MIRTEHIRTFDCLGGRCCVVLAGDGAFGPAATALDDVQALLEGWHRGLSRFAPDSELSRLNDDPRVTVPVSPMLARLARAAVDAGARTAGLVDATLVDAIEHAGYADPWNGTSLDLRAALAAAPPRAPAGPAPLPGWARIVVDEHAGTVTRPPGVRIDSGGLAKGLLADVLAGSLHGYEWFAVDLCGDVRVGGAAGGPRVVEVGDPFGPGVLHRFVVADAAVATSGIGRRSWRDRADRPAHHLLDPATGRPAFTGLVQVTALAPGALEAEERSKAALLVGPGAARALLPHGGLLVHDDGSADLVDPPAPRTRPRVRVNRFGIRPAPELLAARR